MIRAGLGRRRLNQSRRAVKFGWKFFASGSPMQYENYIFEDTCLFAHYYGKSYHFSCSFDRPCFFALLSFHEACAHLFDQDLSSNFHTFDSGGFWN